MAKRYNFVLLKIGIKKWKPLQVLGWVVKNDALLLENQSKVLQSYLILAYIDRVPYSNCLVPILRKAKQLLNGCWLVPPSKCRRNKAQIWENCESYTLGGPPFHGPPSCEAPRQQTIYKTVKGNDFGSHLVYGPLEFRTSFWMPFENRTICELIYFGPFENRTRPVFGSPL